MKTLKKISLVSHTEWGRTHTSFSQESVLSDCVTALWGLSACILVQRREHVNWSIREGDVLGKAHRGSWHACFWERKNQITRDSNMGAASNPNLIMHPEFLLLKVLYFVMWRVWWARLSESVWSHNLYSLPQSLTIQETTCFMQVSLWVWKGWWGKCPHLGNQDNFVKIYLRNQALKISKRNPR